jgi:hypothetical protein
MPKEMPSAKLHLELAELFDRARRAIEESRTLAADGEFIRWWCGMRSRSSKPPAAMLDD